MDLNYYLEAARINLGVTSRTADGEYDGEVDENKPQVAVSKDEIKDLAVYNYLRCVNYLYINKDREFESVEWLRGFLEKVAGMLNHSLTDSDKLYRDFECAHREGYHDYGSKLENLEKDLDTFYSWYFVVIDNELREDEAYDLCAMTEKIFDRDIHPLADGCGRFSKLLSTYILMRNDFQLKRIEDRKEYYDVMDPVVREYNGMFNPLNSKNFIEYYKSLEKI